MLIAIFVVLLPLKTYYFLAVVQNIYFLYLCQMSKSRKLKILRSTIKTKRGKLVYNSYRLNIPEEIALEFEDKFFSVKRVGNSIIFSVTNND